MDVRPGPAIAQRRVISGMVADLHAHYPMHVMSEVTPQTALEQMAQARGRPRFRDKIRALILRVAGALFNLRHPWSGYRVTVEHMREGGVGLVMSVLYQPFDEMDLAKPYGAPPDARYFADLVEDLERVETEVQSHDPFVVRVVRDRGELDACLTAGATALVHCVEGGFHLGNTTGEIEANVDELARRGVAYVTVAHLFFREVATNAPALPFLSDALYDRLFPQPEHDGLTERGVAVLRALVRSRVLIDIAHMRPDAIEATFRLLDTELDPDCEVPVIATHCGYRCGRQTYMLDEHAVRQIKRRDGVIGLIMAQHQLNDGIRRTHTKRLEDSLAVICRHIDNIAEISGGYRHIALGTDFDGFIKPTMGGLEHMGDLKRLESALQERYGKSDAELITWHNAERVLRRVWE